MIAHANDARPGTHCDQVCDSLVALASCFVKHIHTRRYLYLSVDGRAFEGAPCGGFVPMRLDFAIEQGLCTWWILSGWEAEDAEPVRDAVVRAAGSLHG